VSKLRLYLTLGRISNLPTVWSNVLAGAVLSGAALEGPALPLIALAVSLSYTGGMFLNDAFDRGFDAQHQPFRPIPAGLIPASSVFGIGFGLLGAGAGLIGLAGFTRGHATQAVVGATALSAAIVIYDLWHKNNPVSPLLMGICRALVYVTSALTLRGETPIAVWLGALALFAYLNVLTAVAKRAGIPGKVVARFIACISLVDALAIALVGQPGLAILAALSMPLTLLGQRYVRGT
jgi:4-hydroxybenzoate polyprenyltransferase